MATAAATKVQETMVFRSNRKGLQFYVAGTGQVIFTPQGRQERMDESIQFHDTKYVAHRKRKFVIRDQASLDNEGKPQQFVIDEITYMLAHKLNAVNGGMGGDYYWLERGDEDPKALLEKMLAANRHPETGPEFTVEQIMKVAAMASKVTEQATAKSGPPVVKGIRDVQLPNDPPDSQEGWGDGLASTAGLEPAPNEVQADLRALIRSAR